MGKNRIFIVVFYLIFNLFIYGEDSNKILVRNGRNLREWLSDEDVKDMYIYLSGAQIDLDKLTRNPYFYRKEGNGDFFLEIEGNFKDLEIADRGFVKDKFVIGETSYDVKYRPNYNEIAIIYTEGKIYISNKLEMAYLNIEVIDESKRELDSYFDEKTKDFNMRQIVYQNKKTIYGVSHLEAIEVKEGIEKKKLYFSSFSIDNSENLKAETENAKVIIDYPEMALVLMETIPDMSLDPARIEELLDGKIDGVLTLGEEAIAIKSKTSNHPLEVEDIKGLYNEGVFERIGIESSSEEGVDFFEIPFFENKKYIFVQNEWTFISEDLNYIKEMEVREDKKRFLRELNTLLEF